MAVLSTFPRSTSEDRANGAFFKVMESAPMGLLASAALGLAIVGVFQFLFYFYVLPEAWPWALTATLSAALALFFEGLGFYFLVTTVRDFSAGARKEGFIGLAATFLLWAYAVWEATHVAATFDRNTPETWWSVFGIIGTITCIVRVVELRITLTVTSAFQRKNELATANEKAETDRLLILELTGKVNRYEAEKTEIENRKMEAEKAAQLAQEQLIIEQAERETLEREAEITRLRSLLETANRRLSRVDKTGSVLELPTGKKVDVEEAKRQIGIYFQRNNSAPTQAQIAEMLRADERTVRLAFPNGSWKAAINGLCTTDAVTS